MTKKKPAQGWHWFDQPKDRPKLDDEATIDPKIAGAFVRCFAGKDADVVLDYLRAITKNRVIGPHSSDAMLRHLEGQRALVLHIENLIARGRI